MSHPMLPGTASSSACVRMQPGASHGTAQDERYSYVVLRKQPRPVLASPAAAIGRLRAGADGPQDPSPFVPPAGAWTRSSRRQKQQAHALEAAMQGATCPHHHHHTDLKTTFVQAQWHTPIQPGPYLSPQTRSACQIPLSAGFNLLHPIDAASMTAGKVHAVQRKA